LIAGRGRLGARGAALSGETAVLLLLLLLDAAPLNPLSVGSNWLAEALEGAGLLEATSGPEALAVRGIRLGGFKRPRGRAVLLEPSGVFRTWSIGLVPVRGLAT
jgi:hypothetical protein